MKQKNSNEMEGAFFFLSLPFCHKKKKIILLCVLQLAIGTMVIKTLKTAQAPQSLIWSSGQLSVDSNLSSICIHDRKMLHI